MVVVVLLMIGGGLLARGLYRQSGTRTVVVTEPSRSDVPPIEWPGPATVELSEDAAAHPQHAAVRSVLQAHFNAINSRDYGMWQDTVTRAKALDQPRAEWLANYQTTEDGSIRVYRIETEIRGDLRVFLGFMSTQDPSAAPKELPLDCIRWRVVYSLHQESGAWKIDIGSGAVPPEMEPCSMGQR